MDLRFYLISVGGLDYNPRIFQLLASSSTVNSWTSWNHECTILLISPTSMPPAKPNLQHSPNQVVAELAFGFHAALKKLVLSRKKTLCTGPFSSPSFPHLLLLSPHFMLKSLKTSGPGAALYWKHLKKKKKIDLNGKRHGDSNLIKEKLFHSSLSYSTLSFHLICFLISPSLLYFFVVCLMFFFSLTNLF